MTSRPRPLSQSTASSPPDQSTAGGKGDHLTSLAAAGFPVPAFGLVPTTVLERTLERAGLADELDALLGAASETTLDDVAATIAERFAALTLHDDERTDVLEAYAAAGGGSVAVRSSAIGEDGAEQSFAGQGSSYLHVAGDDELARRVVDCWASAWSERALRYRLLHGLPLTGIRTAVVIQAMVASDVSGVLFTIDPTTGTDDVVVSAVYGLGEGLVSGQVDADTITLARADGAVLATQRGEKERRVEAAADGSGIRTVEEPPARRRSLALDAEQLADLHRVGLLVEEHFGGPQDIEWAFAGRRLHLLQARPVTAVGGVPAPAIGAQSSTPPSWSPTLRLWDNANIVENFGEITAPLTFSFTNHVYGIVYLDYCRVLGVPAAHLEKMQPWTRHMLGQFDGRVYYNVLNWYMVLKLVPLPSVQQKVLAATAGIRETTPEITAAQRPFGKYPRLERAIHARTYAGFTYRFFTAKRTVRSFLDDFNAFYAEFERQDLEGRCAHDLFAAYEELEGWMAKRWGPTAVLDAVISLSLGVLYGLTQSWLPDAPEWFLWQAIKVDDERVESAMPAERLTAIAAQVRTDAELTALVTGAPVATLQTAVETSALAGAAWLRGELADYLDHFGDRALNELKLEAPDLREDPSIMWSMLRDAVVLPAAPNAAAPAGAEIQSADDYLRGRLRGPKKLAFAIVRRKVQATLMSRENVRFARSRAFAMVRRLLRAVGSALAKDGLIDDPRDVYLLRLEELRGVFHGTFDPGELSGLVELRRRRQAEQRAGSPPPPRFYTDGLPPTGPLVEDVDVAEGGATDGVLRGRPSCPGIVEAEARVVDAPRDVAGHVLVAYRTDPGWVGALSSAAALLIERGSPLTHVAVVARELDIPTVVQIPGLTKTVQSGMRLRVDGAAGTVELLDHPDQETA
ncbi:MAG: phosphoenolpyruvate synthase [Solirubrobacteraceae bacterium]|nr:phosphoenolpyruvate synthase [Patulibacter sp.]